MKDEIRFAWKEELKELDCPPMSADQLIGKYLGQLYKRCNALLRRLNEQEEIIIRLMVK